MFAGGLRDRLVLLLAQHPRGLASRFDWWRGGCGGPRVGQKSVGSLFGANAYLLGDLWRFFCRTHFIGLDLCGLGGGVVGCSGHGQLA